MSVVLAATPIGNPGDASARLIEALGSADVIAAEDTRRIRRLCSDLGVTPTGRIVSYYDEVERERAPELVAVAAEGGMVLVVSDAGMPTVSDPGYRVVALAIEAGVPVTALPGPSAVVTALAISGLPVDRFCFEGFLPRKGGERSRRIAELVEEPRTMVFFEAPHRLHDCLIALVEGLGPTRQAAVCREISKTYEEVVRGPLAELAEWASGEVRGEITLVVSGASQAEQREARGLVTAQDWAEAVAARVQAGADRKATIAEVAKEAGVQKRAVYDAVLEAGKATKGAAPDGVDRP